MAEPFLAEIRIFAFDYAPVPGWALCNGASLPVAQNQALYTLVANLYGGDSTKFNIPDLRGRVPIGSYTSSILPANVAPPVNQGTAGGSEGVVLTNAQMPSHTHSLQASTLAATQNIPLLEGDAVYAQVAVGPDSTSGATAQPLYAPLSGTATALAPNTISPFTGGGLAHPNVQPSLVVNFCIATTGLYPQRD